MNCAFGLAEDGHCGFLSFSDLEIRKLGKFKHLSLFNMKRSIRMKQC